MTRTATTQAATARVRDKSDTPRGATALREAPGPRDAAVAGSTVGLQVVMVIEVRPPRSHGQSSGSPFDVHLDAVEAAHREVLGIVDSFGGRVEVVLGARVVCAFGGRDVARALDAAVMIQQRRLSEGGDHPSWSCAIAVASGRVLEHDTCRDLGIPVLGVSVERALMLCSWSETASVVADELAVAAADSDEQAAADRVWQLGVSRILVGRETEPIEYWQVEFSDEAPSVDLRRNEIVSAGRSKLLRTERRRRLDAVTAPVNKLAHAWSHGMVRYWSSAKGRGVVASVTTQEFYVDKRFFVVPTPIEEGVSVFFVPRDPIAGGRNPVASLLLVENAKVEVRLDSVDADATSGETEVRDGSSARIRLDLDLSGINDRELAAGEWLTVRITNRNGQPVGVAV